MKGFFLNFVLEFERDSSNSVIENGNAKLPKQKLGPQFFAMKTVDGFDGLPRHLTARLDEVLHCFPSFIRLLAQRPG